MDTRRLFKKASGITKIAEENNIETRKCLMFLETSQRKNKTLNSGRNKNILLTKVKEHAILVLFR